MTTRAELESSLSLQDPEALRLILDAAGVSARGQTTASGLASRIVDAIWWSYATPLGYVADRASFEDVVWHVARRLRVDDRVDRSADGHEQVEQLTVALVGQVEAHGVRVDDLDADSRRRLGASWMPTVALGTSAGGSFATRWASGRVVDLLKTPVGRLLPLLPAVGPYVGAIKGAAVAVHAVAGPLGIALSVLTFNQALGANYRKLVPLVLGVGALRPAPVVDAEEVGAGADDDTAEVPLPAAEEPEAIDHEPEAADEPESADEPEVADEPEEEGLDAEPEVADAPPAADDGVELEVIDEVDGAADAGEPEGAEE